MNFSEPETSRKIHALVSKPTKYKNKFLLWMSRLLLLFLLCGCFLAASTLYGPFRGILASAPDLDSINVQPSGFASVI